MISATTQGLGGLGDLSNWWTEPIVFEKAVVWTMLWEVLGLGAGSMPLTLRFSPMIGGFLYWLRPGTTRLPPWPEQGAADARDAAHAARRGAVRGPARRGGLPAARRRRRPAAGTAAGRLDPTAVGVLLAFGSLLGLRDKVPFLAARAEIYGNLMILFLFPLGNLIVARADRVRVHLVGRRVLEAEPALPVRRDGDDQQHAVEPLESGQAQALAQAPRGSAALLDAARWRRTWAP